MGMERKRTGKEERRKKRDSEKGLVEGSRREIGRRMKIAENEVWKKRNDKEKGGNVNKDKRKRKQRK